MKVLKLSLIFVPLLVACGDTGVDNTDVAHTNSAIVGGITDEGHMYVVGVGDGQAPWCSATVISTNTVLTAAHCVDGMPPSHVHFGTDLLVPHTTMVVSQAVVHPSWAGGTGSDLALLKTQQPMPVQPAVLLRKTLNNSPVYMGPDWTFVGYGVDDGIQGTGFGTKRVAAFPYKTLGPTTTAADQMPVSADFIYYETNIQSGCNGDSGGPSFFIDGMVEKQGAVTSWGSPGCQQYGVYARVDQPYIAAFVQPNIDLFEPNNACKNDGSCNESCNTTEVF
ncbi:MAG TPA: trypsin-like serine protease, partial [Sorangium sp.]|nr:trypsin-like serine protease [Sorangium sp.]